MSSGLEKPSPVNIPVVGPYGNVRIKSSFNRKDQRPAAFKSIGPILADKSPKMTSGPSPKTRSRAVNSPGASSPSTRPSSRIVRQSDSLTSLRNDIFGMIERSFSSDGRGGSQSSDLDALENVFDVPDSAAEDADVTDLAQAEDEKEDVFEISSKLAGVSFKPPSTTGFMAAESPVTRSQLRRQSHSFEFTKPSFSSNDLFRAPESLRRQSSAFEFRSVEPVYENLQRDVASRASLRRRNSSVKDLIKRMETEAKKRVGRIDDPIYDVCARISESSIDSTPAKRNSESEMLPPMSAAKMATTPPSEETWVDGNEFFKHVFQVRSFVFLLSFDYYLCKILRLFDLLLFFFLILSIFYMEALLLAKIFSPLET